MSEINVYEWEDIRKYFPPERIAKIRSEILELRKSGKYTDEDKAEIINLRMDDTKRIESSKLAFVESMEKTNRVLKPEKLQQLLELMDNHARPLAFVCIIPSEHINP